MFHAHHHLRSGSVALWPVMIGIAVAISGCSWRSGAQTCPVKLKVSFADGRIPEGAIVTFHSDLKAGKSYYATGKVQADGTCELSTFAATDGAVPGRHLVTVAPPASPPATMGGALGPPPAAIHPRYRDKNTSGLEFTVTPEGPNQFSIQLERPSA